MASAVGPRVAASCAHECLTVLSADDRLVYLVFTIHSLSLFGRFHSISLFIHLMDYAETFQSIKVGI